MSSEWIAIVLSCNKVLPTIYDTFATRNDAKQFFLKACNFDIDKDVPELYNDDDGYDYDNDTNYNTRCDVDLDTEYHTFPITSTKLFENKIFLDHLEHMNGCCKPYLLIVEKKNYKICDIVNSIEIY